MTSQVLAAHETLLSICRRHNIGSMGALTSRLARTGNAALSRRVRSAARVRGAHAHPDFALPDEVEKALAAYDADMLVLQQWKPESLQDDRVLRKGQATNGGSKTVNRPSDAELAGGSCQAPPPLITRLMGQRRARGSARWKSISTKHSLDKWDV